MIASAPAVRSIPTTMTDSLGGSDQGGVTGQVSTRGPTSNISFDNVQLSYAGGISLLEGGLARGFLPLELQQAEGTHHQFAI